MATSPTSPQSDWPQTELPWMQSAEASPAKTLATADHELVSLENAPALPSSSSGSSKSCVRKSSSSKTSRPFAVEDWISCSGASLRSGMMRNGIVYPLLPLAPLTYGTGFGSSPTHSIPTPTASDHIKRQCTSTEALNFSTGKSVSLDRWCRRYPDPALGWDQEPSEDGVPNPVFVAWLHGLPWSSSN